MDAAQGQDGRLRGGGLPADQGLERGNDLGGDHHRVDGEMGHGAVAALASDGQAEEVRAGPHRAGTDGHLARLQPRPYVQAEHPVDTLEHARLDHGAGSAGHLLGRLEGEADSSGEILAALRQQVSQRQRDGQVHVVAASLHHARADRAIGEPGPLLDRQPVHVGPHQHALARTLAAQGAHHAGPGHTGCDLEPEVAEVIGDHARRVDFLEGQLRLGMEVPAPSEEVAFPGRDGLAQTWWHEAILPNCKWHAPITQGIPAQA